MAEKYTDAETILKFARYLRDIKCDIDKEYTVEVSSLLSEMRYKQQSTQEIDECIEAIEDVIKGLKEMSDTVGTIKEKFTDAKIKGLQKQLRKSQVRETSGRTLDSNNDSGCFSTDSRVLSLSESTPIVQASDDYPSTSENDVTSTRTVTSLHTEPTQHEDTSDPDKIGVDSAC
ncbi:uncharacterized protein LOC132730104 isoform X1 [Ruditapes philippinarum]|uniref:uncharacterized protein LOC132730104 isoform X1 n=1 Tax=Ruditapes philippinarum TaxID=129788 RepID=UPI00295B6F7D|nr:uncharacterized protein LOC132730104 isoform X1 [Ruditapes philippinarum]